MKVEYFIIKDIKLDGTAVSDEEIAANKALREEVRKKRYSITSVCADERTHRVYCGCTNTGGDILYEFDAKTNKMRCLNFQPVCEPHDAKIHRGLWLDRERNSLFFGLATLTSLTKVALGPGARLMRYDIATETFEELGRPSPGSYIQATSYDAKRRLMTGIGQALMLQDFRFDLTLVAALLTTIGYSLNDTIVIFDRIRENRGRLQYVTPKILDDSINQTMGRTLLTGLTTMLALIIMYVFGGEGIHGFCFAMIVGMAVGTYSSVAIASPFLLIHRLKGRLAPAGQGAGGPART